MFQGYHLGNKHTKKFEKNKMNKKPEETHKKYKMKAETETLTFSPLKRTNERLAYA